MIASALPFSYHFPSIISLEAAAVRCRSTHLPLCRPAWDRPPSQGWYPLTHPSSLDVGLVCLLPALSSPECVRGAVARPAGTHERTCLYMCRPGHSPQGRQSSSKANRHKECRKTCPAGPRPPSKRRPPAVPNPTAPCGASSGSAGAQLVPLLPPSRAGGDRSGCTPRRHGTRRRGPNWGPSGSPIRTGPDELVRPRLRSRAEVKAKG